MADRASSLNREVLPPQKANSGLAVVVAASLAMFLALASSAFVLQARMVRSSCTAAPVQHATPVAPDKLMGEWIEEAQECGTPSFDHHADGSVSIYFTTCKDDPPKNAWGIRSATPAVIEVRAVPSE